MPQEIFAHALCVHCKRVLGVATTLLYDVIEEEIVACARKRVTVRVVCVRVSVARLRQLLKMVHNMHRPVEV